jgi:bacterial leucyl aminopeptidase
MRKHLETFTAFHTRYYKSSTGVASAKWLYSQVESTITSSGADKHGASVRMFEHPWGQSSIIATIPGQSNKTIVIGAHQDSINLFFPALFAAPGADDDGSGTVTILEAMRVLLTSDDIAKGKAANTIEFHWYSAEEGGLLGSQAIFADYSRRGRDIKAMFQQDMTGYVSKTLEAGQPESVGVITDFVDVALTEFIKELIATVSIHTYIPPSPSKSRKTSLYTNHHPPPQYCDIPYVLTKCGYACSDHASASKYGYASAFVIESDFRYSDNKIHTTEDKIEYLSFDHMLQHAKLTLAYAFEGGMAEL